MNVVWLAILALVAGPADRSPAPGRAGTGPTALASVPARHCTPEAIGRPPRPRPQGDPSPAAWAEDCDTEEGVDETWLLHLDASAPVDVAPLDWGRPRSATGPDRPGSPPRASIAHFPLRC